MRAWGALLEPQLRPVPARSKRQGQGSAAQGREDRGSGDREIAERAREQKAEPVSSQHGSFLSLLATPAAQMRSAHTRTPPCWDGGVLQRSWFAYWLGCTGLGCSCPRTTMPRPSFEFHMP